MADVLIIDDELMVRTVIAEVAGAMGHTVHVAPNLAQGLEIARTTPCDVVYLDVLLPDGNGLDVIQDIKHLRPMPEIIVITSYGDPDGAEMAVRHGVWEYLQKPLTVDHITLSLSRVLAFRQQKDSGGNGATLVRRDIVGNCPALLASLDLAAEAAASNVNVLLQGETGTGKDLFAKVIHNNSHRAHAAFVTLDCASFTETLIESQLFGHVKGAFTGADRTREGLLKQAHGGTLFLDEIGDLPLHIQGAFLRALETRRFRPVGASHEAESDFRLIAATNKDLHEMVRLDMFRADLLYRLRGLTITLPPLRQRREDLPALVEHYLTLHCDKYGTATKGCSDDFMEAARTYDWPGNVRELVHAVDRACAASYDDPVLYARQLPTEIRVQVARIAARNARGGSLPGTSRPQDMPARLPAISSVPTLNNAHHTPSPHPAQSTSLLGTTQLQGAVTLPTLKEYRQSAEETYLKEVFRQTDGNIRDAVKLSGVSRGHLYELMKKYGVSPNG